MNLLIVESPAKCSKIQGFLGSNYRVIASMGHIRSLVQDINSVGIQKNFEPTYEFMKEKAKTIANLKAAAKDATKVILCSDDDREGEAIAYSLAVLLKLDPKTNPRSAFREITSNAVLDAVSKPRVIDMNRVHSQQSRAMLDMMVGFTISPLLWKNLGGGAALSAGRCQTPALRLVCEREASIEKFTSELSWTIKGVWNGWPASMIDPLSDEESALNYLENHSNEKNATIHSAVTKPWTENPPLALMTSTLQQQVSNLYHCSPKRTMQIAQKLYESGHITYMRTDQTTISEEAVLDARKVIESKWGKLYLGPDTPKKKAAGGNQGAVQAQEAHEAIRPTHFDLMKLPESEDWGIQDHKVYRLIWLRAIQSVMSQAKGESRDVIFNAEGDEGQLPWQAKWKRIIFPGWKAADDKDTSISLANNGDDKDDAVVEEQEGDKAWKVAEALKPGQAIQWQQLKAEPKESKPQGRYTEASLVRDLEKRGIGRPSTFASLIATLVEKTYVEIKDIPSQVEKSRVHHLTAFGQWPPKSEEFSLKKGGEKARMCPSPLGKSVFEFTVKHFPDLFAYDFTANMEKRLDKIAEGKEAWKLVLSDTWGSYKDRYEEMKSATIVSGTNNRRREFPDIPGVIAVLTAKGPLLLKEGATKDDVIFYGWPADIKKGLQDITEAEVLSHIDKTTKQKQGDVLGEWNGHTIFKKKGPYGHYAEWNGVRVNMAEDDDLESISAKILAKQENPSRTLGPFQIKTGSYGPYLQKNGTGKAAKPQYVSIPKETNIEQLTAQQAGEIFEAGLKAKAAFKKSKFKK